METLPRIDCRNIDPWDFGPAEDIGPSWGISAEDKKKIEDSLHLPAQIGNIEDFVQCLEKNFSDIKLVEPLGEGAFSSVYSVEFSDARGKEHTRALKLCNVTKALSRSNKHHFILNQERMGGEWLALLQYNRHVLHTSHAFAYDMINKRFCLIDARRVQKMFQFPSSRYEREYLLIGTLSKYYPAVKTLRDVILEERPLPIEKIRSLAYQLFKGIEAIHQKSLIHRDIKARNLLVNKQGILKIIDFGFARLTNGETAWYGSSGTRLYQAPELLKRRPYNESADLFSAAIVLFEMAVGCRPCERSDSEILIKSRDFYFDLGAHPGLKGVDPDLRLLISKVGAYNPNNRISAKEALQHPFFTKTSVSPIASDSPYYL